MLLKERKRFLKRCRQLEVSGGGQQVRQRSQKAERRSGDTSSKKKWIGACSCCPSTSDGAPGTHYSSCSVGPTQNELRGWHSSGSQQSGARGRHGREPAERHSHGAGLHHPLAHTRSAHSHAHRHHPHPWLHHAQHGVGHRTGAEATQAQRGGLR